MIHGAARAMLGALTRLRLDSRAIALVAAQGFSPDDVPTEGTTIVLARTANLSTGGTAVDRTSEVHPEVVHVAELAARIIGLDVCGVDIVTTDVRGRCARPAAESSRSTPRRAFACTRNRHRQAT